MRIRALLFACAVTGVACAAPVAERAAGGSQDAEDEPNKASGAGDDGSASSARSATKGIRVLGVGLSRTATQSLALALTKLGYRTLHAEGFHPEMPLGRGTRMTEVVTRDAMEYFKTDNFTVLAPAMKLVQEMGIEALVDLPWSACSSDLIKAYPDAKVIVTVRDSAEKWYKSYWEHFRWGAIFPPSLTHSFIAYWRHVTTKTGCGYVTRWPPWPPTEKELATCLGAYQRNLEELRSLVRPENLLVFNVKEGWRPLCDFLGEQVPNATFPRHDSYSFLHWHGGQVTFLAAFYAAHALILGAILWCALRLLRRRATDHREAAPRLLGAAGQKEADDRSKKDA